MEEIDMSEPVIICGVSNKKNKPSGFVYLDLNLQGMDNKFYQMPKMPFYVLDGPLDQVLIVAHAQDAVGRLQTRVGAVAGKIVSIGRPTRRQGCFHWLIQRRAQQHTVQLRRASRTTVGSIASAAWIARRAAGGRLRKEVAATASCK